MRGNRNTLFRRGTVNINLTLREHFQKLVKEWRQLDKHQQRQSGSNEAFGEREQLLTDICAAIDAFEEEKEQRQRDKDTKQDQLNRDGKQIRDAAMKGIQTPSPKKPKFSGHVLIHPEFAFQVTVFRNVTNGKAWRS